MRKGITMKDVAQRAGVSLSTVSFVINNTKGQSITEATRTKVLKAIDELDYKPNYAARSMRTKQVNAIGVVTAYNVKHYYFLEMIDGIMEAAKTYDCGVTLCPSVSAPEDTPSYVRYFQEKRIDGILLIASAHSGDNRHEQQCIQTFKRHGIPFVVIYGATADKETSYVNIDFFQNGYDASMHLYERGCSNLVYIAPLDKNNEDKFLPRTERDRIGGYEAALSDNGGRDGRVLFLPRDFRMANYEAIVEQFRDVSQPDGIVACWATYGMQILNLARDLGIQVPQDMRVIALDSLPYLRHTDPGLSSMRLPFYEIAYKGTDLLMDKLNGKQQQAVRLTMPCELAARESSG